MPKTPEWKWAYYQLKFGYSSSYSSYQINEKEHPPKKVAGSESPGY